MTFPIKGEISDSRIYTTIDVDGGNQSAGIATGAVSNADTQPCAARAT